MKNPPNSRTNLDKALDRFAGTPARAVELRNFMANAIVAQMIDDGDPRQHNFLMELVDNPAGLRAINRAQNTPPPPSSQEEHGSSG